MSDISSTFEAVLPLHGCTHLRPVSPDAQETWQPNVAHAIEEINMFTNPIINNPLTELALRTSSFKPA